MPPGPLGADETYDLLIRGGRVVDGTGNPWFHADVAVVDDRIARVVRPGLVDPGQAERVVDATGLLVAPGFIDINAQGDLGLFDRPGAPNKVFQGVTTEVMGESNTPAPVNELMFSGGDLGSASARRRARDWSRFGDWLEALEDHGVAVNVASFLGGTTVRRYVMGLEDRPPTDDELQRMRRVVADAMDDGALGVATALIYPPGAFASTDELVVVAREAARRGGLYISHVRSESSGLLDALGEAVEIGRRSGAPVEIYHLKAAGKENWKLQEAALARIDSARAAGVDIQASMYPYTAASTSLSACLPPWTSAGGRLRENLGDPGIRERIAREMTHPSDEWENWCRLAGPGGSMIVGVSHRNRDLLGKTVADLARRRGERWPHAVMDLLVEEGSVGMVYFAMSEENVRRQLDVPWMKFGTDANVWDPETAGGMTHPRGYGTYPRILGRYVRDEEILTLEEAIRKMTWAVARRLGLSGRGQVQEGFYADLVVLDPATVYETATFTEPHRLARGVRHLFVNGRAVISDGEATDERPGRFLKGPGAR